jgi:surface carbohydrate biosynthesis protein
MSRLAANPILYVPVESRDREFDARLLVAFAAAERGLLVAFGQQTALFGNLHRLPPGILLLKGLNRVQRRVVELAGEFGHVVVASDEEAVGLSDPDYMLKDIDPGISGGLVAVYAQGEAQARMLVKRRGFGPDQVQVTGNPRIGLLRAPFLDMYREEAAGLRAGEHQYLRGEYVMGIARAIPPDLCGNRLARSGESRGTGAVGRARRA